MKRVVISLAAAACILWINVTSAQVEHIPTLKAVKTGSPPVIDGNLDDACWKNAAVAKGFINSYSMEKAKHQTEASLLYDDGNLYVAYKVHEPELARLKVKVEKRDGTVFGDNNVELFIDPLNTVQSRADRKYFHIIINSKGIVDDRASGGYVEGSKKSWSPDYPVRTGTGRGYWTAEFALPIKELFQGSQMGNIWRINFNRTRRLKGGDVKAIESSCWAPTLVYSHDASKWGYLEGLIIEKEPAPKDFPVRVKRAVLPPARPSGNSILLDIANTSAKTLQLKASVKSTAPSGKTISKDTVVDLTGKRDEQITLDYEIAMETGKHEVLVSFRYLQKVYLLPPATVRISEFLDAYLNRSYYTKEKRARVLIEFNDLIEEAAEELTAKVLLSDKTGKVIVQKSHKIGASDQAIEFKISSLAPGEYPVSVRLLSKGRPVAESKLTLVKHPPAPKGVKEVKIDKENMYILMDGKPFFLIGQCGYESSPEHMKILKDLGLNTWYCFPFAGRWAKLNQLLHNGDIAEIESFFLDCAQPFLDRAEKYKMMVGMALCRITGAYNYRDIGKKLSRATMKKRLSTNVPLLLKSIRNHPNLFFHSPFDEPGDSYIDLSMAFYEVLKKNDPYHPVFLVAPGLDKKTIRACDLPFTDHYWDPFTGTPLSIVARLERARAKTDKLHLPLIEMPALSLWSGAGRERTPMEMDCETYLILIHGARGGVFWFGHMPRNPEGIAAWKKIVSELNALVPIILEKSPKQSITSEQSQAPIHMLVKEHKGATYLIAANTLDRKMAATFTSSALAKSGKAKVLFEGRNVTIKDNVLHDVFDAYDTHVYKLKSALKGESEYKISISTRNMKGFYMPGLASEKYFTQQAKAAYSPYHDVIYLRGRRNTLKSIAIDIADESMFSYDETTHTAKCSKSIYIAFKSRLTVGDKTDPNFHEVLKYSGSRSHGSIMVRGTFEAHYSKIVAFEGHARREAARIEIANCELDRCRNSFSLTHGGKSFIRNCRIHNAQVGINTVSGPVVGCEIYNNENLVWGSVTFVDCKHYKNNFNAAPIQAASNIVFINTEDDYLAKYKFFGRTNPLGRSKYDTVPGSLTCKWYLGIEALDENNQPIKGAKLVAATDDKKYDAKAETDAEGKCRLIVTQFYRDGEGQKDFDYTVKIDTGKGEKVLKQGMRLEKSIRLKYVSGQTKPEELPW